MVVRLFVVFVSSGASSWDELTFSSFPFFAPSSSLIAKVTLIMPDHSETLEEMCSIYNRRVFCPFSFPFVFVFFLPVFFSDKGPRKTPKSEKGSKVFSSRSFSFQDEKCGLFLPFSFLFFPLMCPIFLRGSFSVLLRVEEGKFDVSLLSLLLKRRFMDEGTKLFFSGSLVFKVFFASSFAGKNNLPSFSFFPSSLHHKRGN